MTAHVAIAFAALIMVISACNALLILVVGGVL
jgi:hypothetical protein